MTEATACKAASRCATVTASSVAQVRSLFRNDPTSCVCNDTCARTTVSKEPTPKIEWVLTSLCNATMAALYNTTRFFCTTGDPCWNRYNVRSVKVWNQCKGYVRQKGHRSGHLEFYFDHPQFAWHLHWDRQRTTQQWSLLVSCIRTMLFIWDYQHIWGRITHCAVCVWTTKVTISAETATSLASTATCPILPCGDVKAE